MEPNYDYNNVNDFNSVNTLDNNVVTKTFFWMFLGLLGTAIVAWYTFSSGLYYNIASNSSFAMLAIFEVVVVLVFSLCFRKLSPTIVAGLYFLYSMINGVVFSTIFVVYNMDSIIYAFAATAALFAGLAFYGYKTKEDLTKLGNICIIALIVGLVFSVVNLFVGSSLLDIIITWVMLAIFCGLTAYDLNKLKTAATTGAMEADKLHIYFAMQLYLDFINIFIRLLRLMGSRRN